MRSSCGFEGCNQTQGPMTALGQNRPQAPFGNTGNRDRFFQELPSGTCGIYGGKGSIGAHRRARTQGTD
jgi:hypothetical protein